MALIEHTIYPRFSKVISKNELIKLYTPYDEDISIEAITYLLKCEHKKSEFIEPYVDISFASDKWQKIIKCKFDRKEV